MDERPCLLLVVMFIFFTYSITLNEEENIKLDEEHIMTKSEITHYKEKVREMFKHAYNSYLRYAYPADELMPLSCKGRYRGSEPSRGDIDDSLGNFSLTMIDTLDSLVVLGMLEEFERAVEMVVADVTFDTDVVVSVFETNIRVLGGLLGAHFMAIDLQRNKKAMLKYNNELLRLAKDIGDRLLPAFNTTTGIPYPRVNLRHGVDQTTARTGHEKDTCTSCAGTMILEFAALSRLTGDKVYEERARRAMDFLWKQRHRASDLVGTVINIHNGNWVRRESGVGAGIDSYYEYVFKTYVLLGDETYRDRFNTHYDAIMKYVSQGPLLVDVHMHRPDTNSRLFMDALLAFWPGLQVLKGDVRAAIETHEVLYQVMKRHNFLPEAFTTNFRVHWGQHPLRPEFVESTYFLYKATGDPHYLTVGKKVIENMEAHARVRCGYAAIRDVSYSTHEDKMDSYVLAETFKYLYLLFSDKEELHIDMDQYIFTTEAHLLPLSLANHGFTASPSPPKKLNRSMYIFDNEPTPKFKQTPFNGKYDEHTCPNSHFVYKGDKNYARNLRRPLHNYVNKANPVFRKSTPLLRAKDFNAGDKRQLEILNQMGIRLQTMADGRVQLLHTTSNAQSVELAEDGLRFMQEMIEITKAQQQEALPQEPLYVEVLWPEPQSHVFEAGPAQFGYDLKNLPPVQGRLSLVSPELACQTIQNVDAVRGTIALLVRGGCMFVDKARNIQKAGAIGGIVIDATMDSTNTAGTPLFAMSGDGSDDILIPLAFLYHKQGTQLRELMDKYPSVTVSIFYNPPTVKSDTSTKTPPKCSMPNTPSQASLSIDSTTLPSKQDIEKIVTDFLSGGKTMAKPPRSETPTEPDHKQRKSTHVVEPTVTITTNRKVPKIQEVWEKMFGDKKVTVLSELLSSGVFRIVFTTKNAEQTMSIRSYPRKSGVERFFISKNKPGKVQFIFIIYHSPDLEKPVLNDVYVSVMNLLRDNTNLVSLVQQPDFLLCLAQAMEAAYSDNSELDDFTQHMFAEFLAQLGPKEEEIILGKDLFESSETGSDEGLDDVDKSAESDGVEDVSGTDGDVGGTLPDVVTEIIYTDDVQGNDENGVSTGDGDIPEDNKEIIVNQDWDGEDDDSVEKPHTSIQQESLGVHNEILMENIKNSADNSIDRTGETNVNIDRFDEIIIEDDSVLDEKLQSERSVNEGDVDRRTVIGNNFDAQHSKTTQDDSDNSDAHETTRGGDPSPHDEL